ncbi:unnamed protein product [Caenorhabditis brenneri]
MSSAVILLTVFIGIAEMCGNVHQTGGTISSPSSPQLYTATVEFTTKTAAKQGDFDTIASKKTDKNKDLLDKATPELATVNGKEVLKYTIKEVTCDAAKAFATATKDLNTDIISEGTVDCNGEKTPVL